MRSRIALLLLLAVSPLARAAEVHPFIDDDYAKAVARGRTNRVPLFVDVWAPW